MSNERDLSFLLVIVAHLRQLAPDIPPYQEGSQRKTWQQTHEFKTDIKTVGPALDYLVKWMKTKGERQRKMLRDAEDVFRKECDSLIKRLTGGKGKSKSKTTGGLTYVCLCDKHRDE